MEEDTTEELEPTRPMRERKYILPRMAKLYNTTGMESQKNTDPEVYLPKKGKTKDKRGGG